MTGWLIKVGVLVSIGTKKFTFRIAFMIKEKLKIKKEKKMGCEEKLKKEEADYGGKKEKKK